MNSNRKGKVYEREIAAFLREHGYTDAHRGQQYHGGAVMCPGCQEKRRRS